VLRRNKIPVAAITFPKEGLRQLSRYSNSLRAGRPGDRIPVGARFSTPVQTDPGAHAASCTMGTGVLTGVERPGLVVKHSHTSSNEVKEKVELYLYFLSEPSWLF
jgi:DNA-binding sugar fermentation-stimulating protein